MDFEFFFRNHAESLELFLSFHALMLEEFSDMEIVVQKTQINFRHGCGFAFVSLPRRKTDSGFVLSFGLPEREHSPRIFAAAEPRPGRWTHHTRISSPAQLDDELFFWLSRAYAFAERGRKPR